MKELKSIEVLRNHRHYLPKQYLKFIDGKLYQLWTSCIVGEDDVWAMVEGQEEKL